jgi:arginase
MTAMHLFYPEWQGYGESANVYHGALAMARDLFPGVTFTTIDAPVEERVERTDGVLALRSIAPRFRSAVAQLRASAPSRLVTVGGTCGVEVAPIAYLNERYDGDLAVVWFDAHGDLNTPASSPSSHFHGMSLRTLLGDGPGAYVRELRRPLTPRQVFLAGTRDLDPPEADYITQAQISVTTPEDLDRPEALVARIRDRGFERVYLHLDLDCFRPEDIPDTLMLTPGGPAFAHVQAAMQALKASFDPVGFSIVEYVERGGGSMDRLRGLLQNVEVSV